MCSISSFHSKLCSFSLHPFHSYPFTRCPSSVYTVDCSCTLYLRGFILRCICLLHFPQNCSSNRHLLRLLFQSPSSTFCLPEMTGCVSTYTCASLFSSSCRRPMQNITGSSSSFFQEYYLSHSCVSFLPAMKYRQFPPTVVIRPLKKIMDNSVYVFVIDCIHIIRSLIISNCSATLVAETDRVIPTEVFSLVLESL